jgi:hypothetical protein
VSDQAPQDTANPAEPSSDAQAVVQRALDAATAFVPSASVLLQRLSDSQTELRSFIDQSAKDAPAVVQNALTQAQTWWQSVNLGEQLNQWAAQLPSPDSVMQEAGRWQADVQRQIVALNQLHFCLQQQEEASFLIWPDEQITFAAKARMLDDEHIILADGVVFISNRRLVFEHKETLATGETRQALLWQALWEDVTYTTYQAPLLLVTAQTGGGRLVLLDYLELIEPLLQSRGA